MKKKAEKKDTKRDLNYYLDLKYKIEIVPFSEEDGGGFEARIPQLGRLAFRGYGETMEEALAHLEVVKKDLFERYLRDGVEIPEPEIEEERYSGRILLRIPPYLHQEIAEFARKNDISINHCLNNLIERGLASIKCETQNSKDKKPVSTTAQQFADSKKAYKNKKPMLPTKGPLL